MDSSKGSQDAGAQYADQGTGYESVQGGLQQGAQQHDMGGGRGAMGSGVAGGHEGSASSNNASGNTSNVSNDASAAQGAPAEKKDWLDKGFEAVGKKAGYSMSDKQADSAGDFLNKQFKARTGRNLPGVE